MGCFSCCGRNNDSDGSHSKKEQPPTGATEILDPSNVEVFNFRELAMATKNFRQECLLGEGGFGRVFKGTLQASGQVVAVKQLDRNGMQENKEFTVEALKLSILNHPNLVNLIGYCADGVQRLLVYEFMPLGSLEDQLFGDGPDKKALDWNTRMKIASGAAQGLEYLHERANPVIYGDFKPSNVLLNEDYEPKLADVGLSKLGAGEGTNTPSSRMMDTGYSAPEYSGGGEVTLKSDVYSFGVVLIELITGRKAVDNTRPTDEQNLVTWAKTFFRDPKRFPEMADPRLKTHFPATGLNQAVGIAAMCLQDEPVVRPLISDVTSVLSCISMIPFEPPQASSPPQQQMEYGNEVQQNSTESRSNVSRSDSEDTVSGGATEGESAEHTQSSQYSDGESESGSYSESDGQSDDESTDNSDAEYTENYNVKEASSRKSKREGGSSRKLSQRKDDSSRQIVVSFNEPSAGGNSETNEESSSGSEGNRRDQSRGYSKARKNGASSSHPKRQKRRGRSGSDVQLEHLEIRSL